MQYILKIRYFISFFFLLYINAHGIEKPKSDTIYQVTDANYLLSRYVISSGGSINATNTNLRLNSTLGEEFVFRMAGTNNIIQAGFWSGGLFVTDVGEKENTEIPATFKLLQNYPNPFNPTTRIRYGIPESETVRITIVNILGKEIMVFENEEKEAGYYSIDFNASDLPSGVYFYRIQVGSFIDTKKILLIK